MHFLRKITEESVCFLFNVQLVYKGSSLKVKLIFFIYSSLLSPFLSIFLLSFFIVAYLSPFFSASLHSSFLVAFILYPTLIT
jgi:hypothetical protein